MMRGYAERKVFVGYETALLREAEVLVRKAPNEMLGEEVRCHELARAVGEILGLEASRCIGDFRTAQAVRYEGQGRTMRTPGAASGEQKP